MPCCTLAVHLHHDFSHLHFASRAFYIPEASGLPTALRPQHSAGHVLTHSGFPAAATPDPVLLVRPRTRWVSGETRYRSSRLLHPNLFDLLLELGSPFPYLLFVVLLRMGAVDLQRLKSPFRKFRPCRRHGLVTARIQSVFDQCRLSLQLGHGL